MLKVLFQSHIIYEFVRLQSADFPPCQREWIAQEVEIND